MRTRRSPLAAMLGTTVAVLLCAPSAEAHPHVWVDTRPTLTFEGGKIVAIRQTWYLDEFVSELIMADFDANRNGVLDPEEAEQIAQTAFLGMEDYAFFTHVEVDGRPMTWPEPTDFRAWLEGDRIVYDFVLHLPEPVDPADAAFIVGFFDETYFVDVALAEAVSLTGDGAGRCRAETGPDTGVTIYFGLVHPVRSEVICGRGP